MKNFFHAGQVAAIAIAAAAAAFAAPLQAQVQAATPESGRWLTESGNLEIDIAPCGQALCGTVARVIADRSMSRPDAAMQAADGPGPGRNALGMKVLSEFTPAGGGEWKGRIYNRENGETYDCLIELLAPDQLKVHAYKGNPAQGRTQVWRRVAGAAQ